MTVLQAFLNTIADAGRDLLKGQWQWAAGERRPDARHLAALCADLLSQKGEALGTALAREALRAYGDLEEGERLAFFILLREDYSPDPARLAEAIDRYRRDPGPETALMLSEVSESPRQRLLRALNMAPGGTGALVAMRRDLLRLLRDHKELSPVDADFAHLLASWFNRGFLRLARIDWRTPAIVLEKLIRYEAVHQIRGWEDLRRRLDETDRRCYAFFHPALPEEPLIFVEVALVRGLAASVQALLEETRSDERPDTAIFYSISNCQEGLKGISFGNFLIKQVVSELSTELPHLKTFSTLSPVPGFAKWLRARKAEGGEEPGQECPAGDLESPDWPGDPRAEARLADCLPALCARYLVEEKRDGKPLDSVARFHLGNGARLERINWLADVSPKGMAESFGLMVNYLYDLERIEHYHEDYANNGTVACSRAVKGLLRKPLTLP